jgi:hypothetical protein
LKRTPLLIPIVAAVLAAPAALAQDSPFLPDALFTKLVNEISGDRAFEHDRQLTHFHRTAGSRDFFAAIEYIHEAAQAAGLEDVRLIRQPWDGHGWSCTSGEASLLEPEEVKLASYGAVAMSIADNSRTSHVLAELVDVGAGTSARDYEGKDVKGKVVLASGSPGRAHEEAVWKRGALGVISMATNRPDPIDAPDQVAWGLLPYESKGVDGVKDGTLPTFAVMVTPRRGRWLQQRIASVSTPAKVKVDIESDFPAKEEQAMVEAWIHGTEIHDQQIVLTAHVQETTSANDDGSGCVNMLEIGRALERLIKEGRIPRPRRDIRFWWVNELSSEPRYFMDNPKEARRMLLDLNQDMVGARQSWGGRVQYAARLPWSLPHALDDVMESVLAMVRDGNTSLLTHRGTRTPQPFPREIVAVKGSREPFDARMVPYFDSTDHHAFTPARIGVPGTSLTNWPDEFIHGTADDLENIDATQLERNAVVVAGVALYFAGLADEEAPALAANVAAHGRERLGADLARAVAHVAQAAPASRDSAYRAARNLVHQSYLKEKGALGSIKRLAQKGRTADFVTEAASRLEDDEKSDLAALEASFQAIAGRNPGNPELSKEEREMIGKVYVPVNDLAKWQDAAEKVRHVDGLHRMMEFEVFNFADGRRTAHEVYEAVAAEALSAGEWYYGQVRPADVLEVLERGAKAGALTLKGAK